MSVPITLGDRAGNLQMKQPDLSKLRRLGNHRVGKGREMILIKSVKLLLFCN